MDNPITTQLEIPLIPYTDVNHAAAAYGKVWYAKYKLQVFLGWIGIVALLAGYVYFGDFDETFAWLAIGGLGGYAVMLMAIIYSNGKVYFLKSIAQEWGWTYLPDFTTTSLHTTLLKVGHGHTLDGVLEGNVGQCPAVVGTLSYTIGHGKGSQTFTHSLAKVNVGVVLPHLLFAVDRDFFDNHILSSVHLVSVRIEQLLEKQRSLYVEPGLEIEALQVFTPKVIADIELGWSGYSFEFIGTDVYVYGTQGLTSRVSLQELFSLIQYITNTLLPALMRMQGSVKAMKAAIAEKV